MTEELLTATEAAAYMKISLAAFYAWRRRHQIPSRVEGRSLALFRLGAPAAQDEGQRVEEEEAGAPTGERAGPEADTFTTSRSTASTQA